ncbi:MAG: NrfD/PsrC family molybdoenzyme membrane anchor subunit [Candidatus Methylomirabilales bacterium]
MPPIQQLEPIILMTHKWGTSFNIPWYLFLGGMAGGTLLVAALADLLGGRDERYQALSRIAAYITLPIIIIGGLALTLHLGKPERGVLFPVFMSNYKSWLTIGGWIIAVFFPLNVAYAVYWYFRLQRSTRLILALLSIPTGAGMALYTGFLLSGSWQVAGGNWFTPLWDTRYIPVLFLISGLSTGLAACGLTALAAEHLKLPGIAGRELRGAAETAGPISLFDTLVIILEAGWIYIMLAAFAAGNTGQTLVYKVLTEGNLSPWFWWGFIALALALPFLASLGEVYLVRVLHVHADWLLYVKFLMVLAGGLILRYIIVWGGEIKKPLPFPPSKWPFNIY